MRGEFTELAAHFLLREQGAHPAHVASDEIRLELGRIVNNLEERLRELRDYLADSYRLPVVDQDIL